MSAISRLATGDAAQSFVGHNEWLRVDGGRILNPQGQPVVLRGVSLFWSQWMPQFYNPQAVAWLCSDWRINVIRASMAVHRGGYLEHPARELSKIETVIQAAIDCGIYVIVDWHAHDREQNAAEEFFSMLARKYASHPNLIFELWNEPDGKYDWDRDIRPYHQRVIARIREFDEKRLVIAGTENYCQRVLKAAKSPIDDPNVVYAFHFYAASHRAKFRAAIRQALDSGVALLGSEFGTCEASGDGRFDPLETSVWLGFLDQNLIGYLNWSISDKAETAAALKAGASAVGGWPEHQLTDSGRFVRNHLVARADSGAMTGS